MPLALFTTSNVPGDGNMCRKIAFMVLFSKCQVKESCAPVPDRILSLCWNIIVVARGLWRVDWEPASGHDVCRRWGDWSDFSKKKLSTLWEGKISPRHWVSAQKPWWWWGRPARLNPTAGRLLCQDGGGVQTWNMQSGHLAPALQHRPSCGHLAGHLPLYKQ